MAEACIKVDWENLPTKRDPKNHEYKDYSYPIYSRKDYAYDNYDNYEDIGYGNSMSEIYSNRGKKKRKRNRTKKYYDGGDGLVDISVGYEEYDDYYDVNEVSNLVISPTNIDRVLNSDSKYDWILSKFTDTGLEYWELQIIKEQYLNTNDEYDKFFYDYLLEKMYEEHR